MRVRHSEQAMQGLKALDVRHQGPLDYIEIDVERLRHLLWNGYHDETYRLLASIVGKRGVSPGFARTSERISRTTMTG